MQVVRDEPGRLLHLEETGSRFARRRGKFLLVLSLLWTAPLLPLLGGARGALEHPWMAGYAFGFFYVVIALVTVSVLQTRETVAIVVDRAAGKWTLTQRAFGPFREETREIPSDQIERASVRTAPWVERLARDALAIEIALEPIRLRVALALDGLDRHEEVLDLAMRFGLAGGLAHYRLGAHTLQEFEAHLLRGPSDASLPIPPIAVPSDYDEDETAAEDEVPRSPAPPFDPTWWGGAWRIPVWAPDREAVFRKKGAYGPMGCVYLLLLPFVLAGVLPVWSAVAEPNAPHRWVAILISIVWWTPLALLLRSAILFCIGSEIHVDWAARRVRVQSGATRLDLPLDDLRRIEVVGLHELRSVTRSGPTHNFYSCRVVARRHEEGTLLFAQTEESRDAPEPPYDQAMALGAALAKALGVPLKYKDYR